MDRRRFLPTYHYEDNTTGLLEDSVGKPLRDYKIYGNSLQNGTPTPETPVEIESVGENTINLFDKDNVNYIIGYFNRKSSAITTHANARTIYIPCEPNTTYTISRDTKYANFHLGYTTELPAVGVKPYNGVSADTVTTTYLTTTTGADAKYLIAYLYNGYAEEKNPGGWEAIIGGLQIEEGATATEYEPFGYKVPIKVSGEPYTQPQTTNIYLAEPLRKIGEYADYVDFKNGCVVRNVRCLSLDGSDDEVIVLQSTNSYGISNFYLDGLSDMALSDDCVMCNRLSRQTTNAANTMTEGFRFVITTSTYPYMRISSERVSTVADFRAWLSDNVVSFAYATNAPIIEPIELPEILTGKGTITIMVDTDIQPSCAVWQYYRE